MRVFKTLSLFFLVATGAILVLLWVLPPIRPLLGNRLPIQSKHLTSIQIRTDNTLFSIQKNRDQWRITTPIQDWVDPTISERLNLALTRLKLIKRLPQTTNRASLGLKTPHTILTFYQSNHPPLVVYVGAVNTKTQQVAVEIPSYTLLGLMEAKRVAILTQPMNKWRLLSRIRFSIDSVTNCTIRGFQTVILSQKSSHNWWVSTTTCWLSKADPVGVRQFLMGLQTIPTLQLEKSQHYTNRRPIMAITIESEQADGLQKLPVLIYRANPQQVAVVAGSDSFAMLVNDTWIHPFLKPALEWATPCPFVLPMDGSIQLTIRHLRSKPKLIRGFQTEPMKRFWTVCNGLEIQQTAILNAFVPETQITVMFPNRHQETWLFTSNQGYLMGCIQGIDAWYRFGLLYREWIDLMADITGQSE